MQVEGAVESTPKETKLEPRRWSRPVSLPLNFSERDEFGRNADRHSVPPAKTNHTHARSDTMNANG
jgi:hypothetical protein